MPPAFRLRPGTASDLTHVVRLYDACLGSDKLVDLLFPLKKEDPAGYKTYLYRLYGKRYWSVEWAFTFLVRSGGDGGEREEEAVVGFACWKRARAEIGFGERWFTLFAWIAPLMRAFISVQNTLRAPNIDARAARAFDRCFPPVEKSLFAGKNRDEWRYLSTLAVHPSVQRRGLGALLLGEGLGEADERLGERADRGGGDGKGGKVWLVGLRGTDAFYSRFGFEEVGRANVGELSEWDGGIVMFRE
ncbi:acyl-CoA N-acyltransferase [Trichoderma cornu-damae]|uniref:Acyl-CoA N-acyltransferase n=1 Tax=Trichoderma cornu-damae TaxID=654480 RepID=A0A9P8TYD5_9HYPO|nr:acyl-CoA N-acyltransferase [Trichoderma cornu-damae]